MNTLVTFDGSNGTVRDNSGVIQGSDGNFYGTTQFGGAYGAGTIFSLSPNGTLTVLYNFCAQVSCADGGQPSSGLIQGSDGNYYGTTQIGGSNANTGGTVFKITPSGTLTTLYSFCSQGGSCADGATPTSGLIEATDGNFYGTTKGGGANGSNEGTVFRITPAGTLTTLYSFCSQTGCGDGSQPEARLLQGKDGSFYGTTAFGGITNSTCVAGCGTVFKLSVSGTVTLTSLYKFCSKTNCTDGTNPESPIIQAANGLLYGTTSGGGVMNGTGTVFKVTTAGALTTVHTFGSGAGVALGGVVQAIDGNFYGTTTGGGTNAAGSVFKLTSTNVFSTIYSFCTLGRPDCADGTYPAGTLLQAKNGTFYATTNQGGSSQDGTVYSLFVPMPIGKVTPSSLNFGQVGLGETTAGFPLTLSNVGTGSLSITKLTLSGTNKADFSAVPDPNSCATITPGNPCTIAVTFSPTLVTLEKATLAVITNANALSVPLSGTGVNGAVALLTLSGLPVASINFGSQPAGQQTPAQTVTLTNAGNQTLNIAGFSFSGTNLADFQAPSNSNNCLAASLNPGQFCTFGITFTPASVGARSATLTIKDNALKNPQSLKLAGTGTSGSGPKITVTLNQASVLTLASGSGTVSISPLVAGTGGQQIFLSTNYPGLFDALPVCQGGQTPPCSSVTIPSGSSSTAFSFNTTDIAGSAVITGFAENFQNGTATLSVNSRTMTLKPSPTLVGANGGTTLLSLTLTNKAPSSLQVALSSADPSIATISPATVQIAPNSTTVPIVITGVNTGSTTVMANSPGFSQATAIIKTTNSQLKLGKNLTIAPCQTLPLSISLTPPANPITVKLSSTSTPAGVVSFPATSVSSNAAQMTGKLIGQATVYASDPAGNYAPDNTVVTVADTLNFPQLTLEVPRNGSSNMTLNLGAPPCSTGFTATLTVDDPTIASVPPTVKITTGQSVTFAVTGLKLGTTHLHATGGGSSAVATINVAEIDLNPVTVGAGLETAISASLTSPSTGAESVTISSNNSNVLLSADGVTPGTSSITVPVPSGASGTPNFYVVGAGAPGASATITASTTGYASGSAGATVGASGFYLATPSFTTTVGQPDTPITIQSALLDSSNNISSIQAVAPGTSVSIPVTSSAAVVGTIDTSPVTFSAGATSSSTAFHPLLAGGSTISVMQPAGFTSPATQTSIAATVNSNSAGFANLNSVTVGNELELAYGSLMLTQPAPSGNLTVTVSSADPSVIVVSTSNNVLGDGNPITLVVPAGSTQVPPFYIQSIRSNQSLSAQAVNVQVQAPGYAQATFSVNLVPSGFIFVTPTCAAASSLSTTDHSADTPLNVEVDALDAVTLQPMLVNSCNTTESLIPGTSSVTVNAGTSNCVNSSSATVGSITVSQVMFNPGDGSKTTAFHPLAVGSCTLGIDTPTGFATPAADQNIAATVTAAGLYLNTSATGINLESQLSVSLVAPAPPGNETITITSQDQTKVLLSTDPTQTGSQSVNVIVFAGNSSPSVPIYAQALTGLGASVILTATSQDYGSVTSSLQIVNSAFVVGVSGCPTTGSFSTTPVTGDTSLTVSSTALDSNQNVPTSGCSLLLQQPVAPSAGPVSVPAYTANPQTGQPDNTVGSVTTSPVVFNGGDASLSTAFHPISLGTANVMLTTPANFTTPSANGPGGGYQQVVANVTNGGITMSLANFSGSVGVNLQAPISLSLTTPAPVDTVVNLTSGDPRLVLSTDPTVQGTSSVPVTISAGNYGPSVSIYAQAQYQQNAPPPASVTLTASAPQFDAGTLVVPIVPSGFILGTGCLANGSPDFSTVVLSPDSTVPVYAVPLDANGSYDFSPNTCGPFPEQLNPNIGPVTIAVTSSDPAIGTITSSPLTFNASPGSDDSAQSTIFHPVAATTSGPIQLILGTPSITGVSPTGFNVPNNFQSANVTISNPTFYLNVGPVGNSLQAPISLQLTQAAPSGGEQVTVSSDNGNALTLSADPLQPGTPTVQITIPAGQYSPATPIYAQVTGGPSPSNPNPVTSVNLTASGSSFDPQTTPVSLVPSGFVTAWGGIFCVGDPLNDPTSTTIYSPDSAFGVYVVPLDPTTFNLLASYLYAGCYFPANQQLNPGVGPITIAITDGNTNIGTINPASVTFNTGDSQQASSFHPLSNGNSALTLPSSVSGFTTPSNYQTLTANVVPATINVASVFVGQSMEVPTSFYLAPSATSSFTVTVKSGILSNNVCTVPQGGNTNLLLSSDPNATGSTALNLQFNQGDQSSPTFWVQAQPQNPANLPLSDCLLVTANDPQQDYQQAFAPVSVIKSGFVVSNLGLNVVSFNTTVGSADTTLTVSPASLDSNSNIYDFEALIPGVSVQVPVLTSKTCSSAASQLDATYGRITQSPVVFSGAPEPGSENTSFHPVASGGSDVIVIPAATGSSTQVPSYSFSQASNDNCITANVN